MRVVHSIAVVIILMRRVEGINPPEYSIDEGINNSTNGMHEDTNMSITDVIDYRRNGSTNSINEDENGILNGIVNYLNENANEIINCIINDSMDESSAINYATNQNITDQRINNIAEEEDCYAYLLSNEEMPDSDEMTGNIQDSNPQETVDKPIVNSEECLLPLAEIEQAQDTVHNSPLGSPINNQDSHFTPDDGSLSSDQLSDDEFDIFEDIMSSDMEIDESLSDEIHINPQAFLHVDIMIAE